MIVVVFQVRPKADRLDEYLEIARGLRPEVEAIPGFLDNERFRCLGGGNRILSLSVWEDEAALARWRGHDMHRRAQEKGRFEVFEDYRIRVGAVVGEVEAGSADILTLTEIPPPAAEWFAGRVGAVAEGMPGLAGHETYDSLATPGRRLWLASWSAVAGPAGRDVLRSVGDRPGLRHRRLRILRDYGMADRRQAP